MKIPVCPRCGEPRTLKLTDNLTVRCYRAHGGCGERYTLGHPFVVRDSSSKPVNLYRDETDPSIERGPHGRARKKVKA